MTPVGRIILKSISQSKKLSRLKTHGARLLYTWLIPNLDKNGCFSGEAGVIKGLIFTRLNDTELDIEEFLIDLMREELIVRYEINGDVFLNVPDFEDRQPYINKSREAKSLIPLPTPELIRIYSGSIPDLIPLKVKLKSKSKVKVKAKFSLPFEEFWKNYPKKKGKVIAYSSWGEHPKKNHQELIDASLNYRMVCACDKTELKFIKDPSGFLRRSKEYWKDYLKPVDPPRRVGENVKDPDSMPDKIWNKIAESLYGIGKTEKEVAKIYALSIKYYRDIKDKIATMTPPHFIVRWLEEEEKNVKN